MTEITRTIGSGQDHTTLQDWEDNLDNVAYYESGDDAIGQIVGTIAQTAITTVNGGTTVGLNSVHLTVASANRGDGTAGTGDGLIKSSDVTFFSVWTPNGFNKYRFSWMDLDGNGKKHEVFNCEDQSFGDVAIIDHNIMYDNIEGNIYHGAIAASTRDILAHNNIIYNSQRATSIDVSGITFDGDMATGGCYNNTVYGIKNTSSGDSIGIRVYTNSTNHNNKNNISMGNTSASGTVYDFLYAGTDNVADYNLSGDATADDAGGSNHQISKTAADQFQSVVSGLEDFRLLDTDADAYANGMDLSSTGIADIELDITGFDRTGLTWSIGAVQKPPSTGSTLLPIKFNSGLINNSLIIPRLVT